MTTDVIVNGSPIIRLEKLTRYMPPLLRKSRPDGRCSRRLPAPCREVDPVGGTTASGFVIGRGTVSDLSQNQATKACCCCDCGHVGKAAALSKQSVMSTALASRMPLVPARHTAMGACPPNA